MAQNPAENANQNFEQAMQREINALVQMIKDIDGLINVVKKDPQLPANKKSIITNIHNRVETLKTIVLRMRETVQSSQINALIEQYQEIVAKLAQLLEPPSFIAVFERFSEIEIPPSAIAQEENIKIIRVWLTLPSEQEIMGSVSEELSAKLTPGQFVLISRDYNIISIIPEDEVKNFKVLEEATVHGVMGNVITTHGSSTAAVKAAFPSAIVQKELATKPLEEGDVVFLIGNIIVAISERKKLTTTLEKSRIKKVSISDIGGLDEQIEELKDLLALGEDAKYQEEMGEGQPIGVVLAGPPGCGKTMIVTALANELNWFLQVIPGSRIENKFIGETEKAIEEAFKIAEKNRPGIVFIDEAEALFPVRGGSISTEYTNSYISAFNSIVDGIEKLEGVFVILATNRIDKLDPAVMRPGRTDKVITIPQPKTEKHADSILRIYLKDTPVAQKETAPNEIIGFWSKKIIEELFEESSSTEILTAFFNETERTFYFKDFISGALIASIVKELKRRARKRMKQEKIPPDKNHPNFGVKDCDLDNLVKQILTKSVPTEKRTLDHWMLDHGYPVANQVIFNTELFKEK